MADDVIAAHSERAVRGVASRWGLALGVGSPVAVLLPDEARSVLEYAAGVRDISTAQLVTTKSCS